MAESRKHFPYWLVGCAVLLMIVAGVLGFIETVGRRGTPFHRYERLGGMFKPKAPVVKKDVVAILGMPTKIENRTKRGEVCEWQDGPVEIRVCFSHTEDSEPEAIWCRYDEDSEYRPSISWRIRRWAQQAWMAIHGPRH